MAIEKVNPGTPIFGISAETWNAFVDAANRKQDSGKTAKQMPIFKNADVVRVQNVSGSSIDRLMAVAVTGVVQAPAASDDNSDASTEFINHLCLQVSTPASTDSGKFLVLIDPLDDQEIGWAISAGVAVCNINIDKVTDTFADVDPGNTILKSGKSGVNMLWVAGGVGTASGTGNQLGVVRLTPDSPLKMTADNVGDDPDGGILVNAKTKILNILNSIPETGGRKDFDLKKHVSDKSRTDFEYRGNKMQYYPATHDPMDGIRYFNFNVRGDDGDGWNNCQFIVTYAQPYTSTADPDDTTTRNAEAQIGVQVGYHDYEFTVVDPDGDWTATINDDCTISFTPPTKTITVRGLPIT